MMYAEMQETEAQTASAKTWGTPVSVLEALGVFDL